MNRMKEWQKQKLKPPSPVKIHRGSETLNKVTDLVIDRFGVTIGGKELVQDTQLKIVFLLINILLYLVVLEVQFDLTKLFLVHWVIESD